VEINVMKNKILAP